MRKPIYNLTFIFFLFAFTAVAQTGEHPPYFKDCENTSASFVEKSNCSVQALAQYIRSNLQIPANVDVAGTVYIGFTVEKTGQLSKIHLEKSLTPACDSAALNVVHSMSFWIPAQQNSTEVDYDMVLPIKFRQADDSADSNGFQLTWGQLQGQKAKKKYCFNK